MTFGITQAQAQAKLDEYLAAETAVLAGQRYVINGRELWRADIRYIQAGIETWNTRVISLGLRQSGRGRVRVMRTA